MNTTLRHDYAAGTQVIIGANSAIAKALAHRLAADGSHLILAGRRLESVRAQADEIRSRYSTQVDVVAMDALNPQSFPEFVERCCSLSSHRLSAVIICHGALYLDPPEVNVCQALTEAMQTNFVSAAQLLECFASRPGVLQNGQLVVVSSVAGDRGRPSNYWYGAAKAGLTAYASGLRGRLFSRGIHVLTVKPGLTLSPMTASRFPGGAWFIATPDRVALDIVSAMRRRANVIYTPWWWRWVMAFTCLMPESIFKRMKS